MQVGIAVGGMAAAGMLLPTQFARALPMRPVSACLRVAATASGLVVRVVENACFPRQEGTCKSRGSIAMATTFSQIMRTMQEAYEKLDAQTK